MRVKDKLIKLASGLLIISIISPAIFLSASQKALAQPGSTAAVSVPVADIPAETSSWLTQILHVTNTSSTVTDTGLHIKDFAEFLLKETLKRIAKAVLAKITQATINWINSDFHGSPLFIENPESFFKDIAKSEIRNLVDMIGYDTFRFPFGKDTALNVIESYRRQLADNAAYTLSKVINDPDLLIKYRNDFSYGGWNGFLINTQYPQNNYLGFQNIIQQNLASRLQGTLVAPAQKIQNLLQQGMGFLSPQTCPSNPNYNNGVNEFQKPRFKSEKFTLPDGVDPDSAEAIDAIKSWQARDAAARAAWSDPKGPNVCPGGLVSTTPGSVAADQIMTAMSSSYRQNEYAAALGNSLSAIFDALINHFMNKGLTALSNVVSPPPKEDNWSYNGQTLGGSVVVPPSAPNDLIIPQNVSVLITETTRTNISGGTAPFKIKTVPDPKIATAQISFSGSSNPALEIKGIAQGQTFLLVEDSSKPVKTVSVQIAVNAVGALVVNPANISLSVNNSMNANISGGIKPYFMQSGPDENKAVVAFLDTSLVFIGVSSGTTRVILRDSSVPPKTKTVPITITGIAELDIPQNISIIPGETSDITISGGRAPYFLERESEPTVATATIIDSKLSIKGVGRGQTVVIVKDSSTPEKYTSMQILVGEAPAKTN